MSLQKVRKIKMKVKFRLMCTYTHPLAFSNSCCSLSRAGLINVFNNDVLQIAK